MPKILKHGNTWKECYCPECDCKIGYTYKEIKEDYDEMFCHYYLQKYIDCPECGVKIILNEYKEELW